MNLSVFVIQTTKGRRKTIEEVVVPLKKNKGRVSKII